MPIRLPGEPQALIAMGNPRVSAPHGPRLTHTHTHTPVALCATFFNPSDYIMTCKGWPRGGKKKKKEKTP